MLEIRVFSFALMSTHTHKGALAVGRETIGEYVHRVHSPFSLWWNAVHDGLGPVFAERPRSVIVLKEEQLAILIAYIHNNPQRAGLVLDPADTDWTSHRAFIGLVAAPPWLHVEWALATMGFSASPSGRLAFHDFVRSRAALPRDPRLAGPGAVPAGLGDVLLRIVARQTGIEPADVCRPGRNGEAKDARRLLIQTATDVFGVGVERLAKELGLSKSMISRVNRKAALGAPPTEDAVDLLVENYLNEMAKAPLSKVERPSVRCTRPQEVARRRIG